MCVDAREPRQCSETTPGAAGPQGHVLCCWGSPGPTSGDLLTLHSREVGSMPLRDQAGLYSAQSSAGASPDCSRIQPLRSRHAARSHKCGKKRANRVWLVVQHHMGHEDTHSHPQQHPLVLRVWGNF